VTSGGAELLQPVGQRAPGAQDVSPGDRACPLGVFVTECVEPLLVLVERMLLMVREQGEDTFRSAGPVSKYSSRIPRGLGPKLVTPTRSGSYHVEHERHAIMTSDYQPPSDPQEDSESLQSDETRGWARVWDFLDALIMAPWQNQTFQRIRKPELHPDEDAAPLPVR
jgi:hypothetical protein